MGKRTERVMEGLGVTTLMIPPPTMLGPRRLSEMYIHPKDDRRQESPSTSSSVYHRPLSPLSRPLAPCEVALLPRSSHSVSLSSFVPAVSSSLPSSQCRSRSGFDGVIDRVASLSSLPSTPSSYAETTERPSSRSLFSSAVQHAFENIALKRRKDASPADPSPVLPTLPSGCLSRPSDITSSTRQRKTHATDNVPLSLSKASATACSSEVNKFGDPSLVSWCLWKSFFSRNIGVPPCPSSLRCLRLQLQNILHTLLLLVLLLSLSLSSLAPCYQYHPSSVHMVKHARQTGQISPVLLPHLLSARAADTTDVSTSASEGEEDNTSSPKKRVKHLIPPYNYQEILDEIHDLASTYPDLVRLRDWGAETGLNVFMEK